MKFSLKHVYGLPEARCQRTQELLSEYGILPGGVVAESTQSVQEESEPAETGVSPRRAFRANRDDLALQEWRRLAGIQ